MTNACYKGPFSHFKSILDYVRAAVNHSPADLTAFPTLRQNPTSLMLLLILTKSQTLFIVILTYSTKGIWCQICARKFQRNVSLIHS